MLLCLLSKRKLKCKSRNLENVTLVVNVRGVNSKGQGLAYVPFKIKGRRFKHGGNKKTSNAQKRSCTVEDRVDK